MNEVETRFGEHRQVNRELSWLDFNCRVLGLAEEPGIPLLERAKFCAIVSTNLDEFRARALARLVLLPRDDPQFRRNKERINRDAEREYISIEWELGLPDGSE